MLPAAGHANPGRDSGHLPLGLTHSGALHDHCVTGAGWRFMQIQKLNTGC